MPIFNLGPDPFNPDAKKRKAIELPNLTDGKVDPPPRPMEAPASMADPRAITVEAPVKDRYHQWYDTRADYLDKTPGRWKSGLLGSLSGFLQGIGSGGGLAGGLGGAISGGAYGAIAPRKLREAQFNAQVMPKLQQRWQFEDQDRTRQMQQGQFDQESQYNAARTANVQADTALKGAETTKALRPPTPAAKPQEWKLGRNKATGQFKWYDAADSTQAGEHDAYVKPDDYQPVFRVDNKGNYVDVKAAAAKGQPVKAFQKPQGAPKPKEEKKFVSRSQVRKAAAENNINESDAAAAFVSKGYRIVN
jgi:hypothetical protein